MPRPKRTIVVIGGGTSGAVMASRLSEDATLDVILLEAGPDHDAYQPANQIPAHAADTWRGEGLHLMPIPMTTESGATLMIQGRLLGGTSAFNGMATLRGQPADYDAWAARGLDGWSWRDVEDSFIRAERDLDFHNAPIHGAEGPLPVRRWRREELSTGQSAFLDGMVQVGHTASADINDPSALPGVGVFPVTIDAENRRVSTSLAYLDDTVRGRPNLRIRTCATVSRLEISNGQVNGALLASGELVQADEFVLTAGAVHSAALLLRSGVGPKAQLEAHGLPVHVDLPVGETMSDHLGPGLLYKHDGPRGSDAGPAQAVLVGASGISNAAQMDYHLMPISLHDPARRPLTFSEKLRFLSAGETRSSAPDWDTLLQIARFLATPSRDATLLLVAAFLLCSSGRGSVRLGETIADEPVVTAPPLPEDGIARLAHAFRQLHAWEQSTAFSDAGLAPIFPTDLSAADAVERALARNTISYGHMVGTCPMGPVLDADCRVHGVLNLRLADASVMPTIPAGNTYLGCVMVAERVAAKMRSQA